MKTYTLEELKNAMKSGGVSTLDIVIRLEAGSTVFLIYYRLIAIHSQPIKFISIRYSRMIDESCHVNANTAFNKDWKEENVTVPLSPEGAMLQITSFIGNEKKKVGFQHIDFIMNSEFVDIFSNENSEDRR